MDVAAIAVTSAWVAQCVDRNRLASACATVSERIASAATPRFSILPLISPSYCGLVGPTLASCPGGASATYPVLTLSRQSQGTAIVSDHNSITTTPGVDLSDENVHWDLRSEMSYADYLRLKSLLDCQRPLSTAHDELLFIVIHQSSELWIKLCLHEVEG